MSDAQQAVDVYLQAAELNTDDELREGSLLVFPNYGQVVMTGDLHGHRRNFDKLQRYCDLQRYGARHVMLHELIHEDVQELGQHGHIEARHQRRRALRGDWRYMVTAACRLTSRPAARPPALQASPCCACETG